MPTPVDDRKKVTQLIFAKYRLVLMVVFLTLPSAIQAFTLPANFENVEAIGDLEDPDALAFSPDGRMFISERITGKLRVAKYNAVADAWTLNPTPFHTFDTPKNASGEPEALRSAGLRDIAFDPDFLNNGLIYAFYMKNGVLQNRLVRIKESATTPDVSDASFGTGGEELLLELPFNNTAASGSHNGGALEFGGDNYLYITTGDGWEGEFQGDPVQSLSTFTGKVLRVEPDGDIPASNPFFSQTTGEHRAIYALGLRNPYSMSRNPDTDDLYINEARGANKADIYLVEAGANYQHEGSGIGTNKSPWANASGAGGELITGGAWMPEAGAGGFPASFNGVYFTALWGGNSTATGQISYVQSNTNTSVSAFEKDVGIIGSNGIPVKPVVTRIGPEGDLYYLLTTYTTSSGAVRRVRFTTQQTVATPGFSPTGGVTENPVNVTISTITPDADIYYTTDNSEPTMSSQLYDDTPVNISSDTILKARAFKPQFNPSAIASDAYLIGLRPNNQPPIVDAGDDKVVFVGQNVTLDGSGTTDPDGNDDFLTGEQWTQLAGPPVDIQDASEEIASFTPQDVGVYQFQLEVSDGFDSGFDTVEITAIVVPRVEAGLQVLYTFEEGEGGTVTDESGVAPALNLTINNPANVSWIEGGGLSINANTRISAPDNKIYNACGTANEITIEAWIKPLNTTQSGPKRIVSLSANLHNRNFTLGQEGDRYDTRLRTTSTDNNGVPSLTVPASTVNTELTHIVYTRETNGEAKIYINGVPQVAGSVGGDMSNWNDSYSMTLVNEMTDDRDWLGEIYLVAVYCVALNDALVTQNFASGPTPFGGEPPADRDEDGIIDSVDNCPDEANSDQLDTDGDASGDVCDADKDNDGVVNDLDTDELNPFVCQDADFDTCDDCAMGIDGFGPLPDNNPLNDGIDTDIDGLCNKGDEDDDNDGVPDTIDNCPQVINPNQRIDVCALYPMTCALIETPTGNFVPICF